MQLKSPNATPIHVALLSGHAVTILEAREVPAMFVQEAFAKGAIPAEMNADAFVAPEGGTVEPTTAELLVAGIKKMLIEQPDDFTGAGLPNRKILSGVVGWNVSAEELGAAWAALQAE